MKDILTILRETNSIYIFGAQSRAKTVMGYVKELFPDLSIHAFLVDNDEENEGQIEQIPVLHPAHAILLDVNAPVLLATKGIYHGHITESLKAKGFVTVLPITVEADNCLRNAYVGKIYAKQGRAFVKLEHLCARHFKSTPAPAESHEENSRKCSDANIYVAKSIYDNPTENAYTYPSWEIPIQVGAALTDVRLEGIEVFDNMGDHISDRNRQYCELTGLYWMWKNAPGDISGLAHYRRHFILPDDWVDVMVRHEIDAIVPVPTYVYPDIDTNYRQRHIPDDWDYLLQYLKVLDIHTYETAIEVFRGNLYLPCNMFIAKWDVLDALCNWMFPILNAVAEHGGIKEDTYMNRYVGFISERLITLFFTLYKDKYNIVYADRVFLK